MSLEPSSRPPVSIAYTGPTLLNMPLLNKGSAFSDEERQEFHLTGLLPSKHETIEQQAGRAYQQYISFDDAIHKHIYLRAIQDKNETLFYKLVLDHIDEMMPIIYTPTVGEACERFSEIYRNHRGLFIAYPDRHHIDDMLDNVTKENIKVIVVTDGSRILGLGDQGIGGMGIPIGKLSLYTACGGISPAYTLPITLDVGTNNQSLLMDPLYMGWHHRRIEQEEYDEFLDLFVTAVKKRWPNVLLQFEDFEQKNALPLLTRYRDKICCFNDDIQGTASVTVGSLLAACHFKNTKLSEQNIVFLGAGAAGCGIAEQVVAQMCVEGLSEQQARSQIFMVGRFGLITDDTVTVADFQQPFVHSAASLKNWEYAGVFPLLQDVIQNARAGVLIGVSGQAGLFTEEVIKAMHLRCEQPIIFPLSNPSKKIEAIPKDIIEWTNGKAIIATGSPFEPVFYKDESYAIPQCNNSYIFPGIGLAIVAANITRISDEMLMKASEILAAESPIMKTGKGSILPPLSDIAHLSKKIAFGIGKLAQEQKLAEKMSDEQLDKNIEANFWLPEYRTYQRAT
jgi:malate dehydrogenase (oxaloacetate-decarboxylating)